MARKITVVINANDQAKPTLVAVEASASRIGNAFVKSNRQIESSSNSTSKNVQKGFGNVFSTIDKQAQKTAKQSASAFDKNLNSSFFSKLGKDASSAFNRNFSISGLSGGSGGLSGIIGTAMGIAGGNLLTSTLSSVAGAMSSGVKAGFDFNKLKEQSLLGFEIKLKGKEEARRFFDQVSDFAEKTPLELDQALVSVQRLMATFSAPQSLAVIKAVTDAVSAQGKVGGEAREQIDGIGLALQQIVLKQKVSAEELTQLAERQINGWKYLGDEIAKTDKRFATLTDEQRVAKVQELAQKGMLNAQTAVGVIVKGLQQEYGGTAERIARETAAGLESNISDVLNRSAGIATESAFDRYKQGLNKFYDVLQTGGAEKTAGGISATTGGVFDAIEKTISAAKSGNIKQLGLDMMSGAVDGVKAGAGKLYDSTVGAVQRAYEGAEAYNESHSPSERYKRLGIWAMQGYSLGLLNDKDKVKKTMREVISSADLEKIIQENAKRKGLDPNLIRAVIGQESSGDKKAVSRAGARGLMQLMPATAQRFGVTDIFDPKQNVRGGSDYLKFLLEKFQGDVRLALAGYNAGEGAVQKYGGIPPYKETQDYVRKISANYAQMSNSGGVGQADAMAELREENKIQFEHAFKGWLDTTFGHDAVVQFNIAQLDFWEKVYKEQQPQRTRDFASEGVAVGHSGWSRGAPLPVEVINLKNVGEFNKDFHEGNIEGFGNDGASLQPFKGNISPKSAKDVLDLFKLARGEAIETSNELSHLSLEITPRALESVKAVAASTEDAFANLPPLIKASGDEAKQFERVSKDVASVVGNAFEQAFNGEGLRGAWNTLRSDFKSLLVGMGKDLVVSRVYKFLNGATKDEATGANASNGGGLLNSIFGSVKGLLGNRGAATTPPFAGGDIPLPTGNPASSALSLLSNFTPRIGGAFGFGMPDAKTFQSLISTTAGSGLAPAIPPALSDSAINAMRGGMVKLPSSPFGGGSGAATGLTGSLSSMAGMGLVMGGGFLGSKAGGSSQIGQLIGGAGGMLAAGAAGASGLFGAGVAGSFGSLAPLLTNPITAIVAGGLIGGALLINHFSHRTEKALQKAIRETYGIDIRDMATLKQIKQIGEQTFGKGNVSKHINEVIKLDAVKQAIQAYAENTGQDASKIATNAQYGDASFKGNQFITPLATPSAPVVPVSAGTSSSASGQSSSGSQGGGTSAPSLGSLLNRLATALETIEPTNEEKIVKIGARGAAEEIGHANNIALRSGTVRQAQQEALGMRT